MPTMHEAEELLSPHFSTFWSAVKKAFARYLEINREELGAIHDRTKASYINDLIVRNLREMLPDAVWQTTRGQRRMWIRGIACVRIKKVNRNLEPHNIATQAQFDFYEGLINIQPRFDNMPPPMPLFLGYTMNYTKTSPENVFIICADGVLNRRYTRCIENVKPRIAWVIPVPDLEQGSPLAQPLPLQPTPQQVTRRVRTKGAIKAPKNNKKED